MPDQEHWTVAEGIDQGLPLIIRVRALPSAFFQRSPHLVRISWRYAEGEQGLPDAQDQASLDKFEKALEFLEGDATATLAAVITGGRVRDFYLYADDTQRFVDGFHSMPQEESPYPVTIAVTQDEGGAFYRELSDSLR